MAHPTDYTRTLPPELLSRILRFNLDKVFNFNRASRGANIKSHLDPQFGPWAYAHTCQRWRSLVWSDIRFWSDLALNLDRSRDRPYPGRVALLRLTIDRYLSLYRPGSRLLRVHILDDKPSKEPNHPYLDEVVKTSPYWHMASICLGYSLFPTLNTIHGKIPNLKTLDLKITEEKILERPLEAFADAPRLVNIEIFGFPHFFSRVIMPWSHIQRMAFMFMESVDAFEALYASRNSVQSLFIEEPSHSQDPITVSFDTPVELDHLEAVLITIALPPVITSFTDIFILPALKHIQVQTLFGDREALTTPEMMFSFCRMLSRSNLAHSLHTLDFANVASDEEIAQMLRLVPGLKRLGLMNCSIATAELLTYKPFANPPCLCRELTKFRTMLNQQASSATVAAYIDLIHSRTNPSTVNNGDDTRPVHLSWFQILPFVSERDLKPSDRRKLRKVNPPNFKLLLTETEETPWLYTHFGL